MSFGCICVSLVARGYIIKSYKEVRSHVEVPFTSSHFRYEKLISLSNVTHANVQSHS